MKCELCTDTIYEGEQADDFRAHRWCIHIQQAIDLCTHFMHVRRVNGLPTPLSPLFHRTSVGGP